MLDYSRFDQAIGLNFYETDPDLKDAVDRLVPKEDRDDAHELLTAVGAVVGGPVAERAEVTDSNPPQLERYDKWGNDVGRVVHHPGALETKRDLYETYLSVPHRRGRPFHPLVASACTYLLNQAETGMACAVGMTSGVANLVDAFGSDEVKDHFLPRLRSPEWETYWDGAMFLTERDGGSDLGAATKTRATHVDGDLWVLNGFKWFCSNVDADAIATLARPEGAPDGVAGIALFVVPRMRRDGTPNGIRIHRLKDKLGTRAVPTGEVDFCDAEAYILAGGAGESSAVDGKGLGRMMSGMVQASRLGVGLMGLGIARRSFLESCIYASHRRAFRATIDSFPMMRATLVRMAVELEGAAALCFEAAVSRGEQWRLLPTLAKLRACRLGVEQASAAVEVHGGNGYIEDWPLARQLRDAQCHPIWEGTENIIALDVMRALERDGALEPFMARVEDALTVADEHPASAAVAALVRDFMSEAREAVAYVAGAPKDVAQLHAGRIAGYLADCASAAFLCEEAGWELATRGSARKVAVARLYASAHLQAPPLRGIGREDRLVLDLFEPITRYGEVEPDRLMALA